MRAAAQVHVAGTVVADHGSPDSREGLHQPTNPTQPNQQDVDKKYISKLKEIEVMFDTSSNYKNYRDRLDVIEPPLIPFQGTRLLHARVW
jgi:hypothetical protein